MSPLEILAISSCAGFIAGVLLIIYSACRVSGEISEREDGDRWR